MGIYTNRSASSSRAYRKLAHLLHILTLWPTKTQIWELHVAHLTISSISGGPDYGLTTLLSDTCSDESAIEETFRVSEPCERDVAHGVTDGGGKFPKSRKIEGPFAVSKRGTTEAVSGDIPDGVLERLCGRDAKFIANGTGEVLDFGPGTELCDEYRACGDIAEFSVDGPKKDTECYVLSIMLLHATFFVSK